MAIDKKLDAERASRYERMKKEITEQQSRHLPLSQTTIDLVLGGSGEALGIYPNEILNLVADSSGGKSFLAVQYIYALTGYINAGLSDEYTSATHDILNGENGVKFDTQSMYGMEMNKNAEAKTIEDVFCEIIKGLKINKKKNKGKTKGKNLNIIVVDSLDSFPSEATLSQGEERVKLYEKDKEYTQKTFSLEKNKYLSGEFFPTIVPELEGSDTLLIIISQVREKIGVSFGSSFKVTGGKALEFYCTYRLLVAETEKLQETVQGTTLDYGKLLRFKTLKVRSSKPYRTCYSVLRFDYGFDRVQSDIIYLYDLVTEKGKLKNDAASRNLSWVGEGGDLKEASKENIYEFLSNREEKINGLKSNSSKKVMMELIDSDEDLKEAYVKVFGTGMGLEEFTQYIYANNLKDALRDKVIEKWDAIESAVATVGRVRDF